MDAAARQTHPESDTESWPHTEGHWRVESARYVVIARYRGDPGHDASIRM